VSDTPKFYTTEGTKEGSPYDEPLTYSKPLGDASQAPQPQTAPRAPQQPVQSVAFTKVGTGYVSAALLAVGSFCPVVSISFIGNINANLFSGKGNIGYILVGLATLASVFCWIDRRRLLLGTGLAALGASIYQLMQYRSMQADFASSNAPFGLGEAMASSVQLQWGWIVIFIAIALMLYTPFSKRHA